MSFWASRRVMVTGASGFLGRHVVRRLARAGVHEVFTPDHAGYDLTDRAAIRRAFDEGRPDVVLHLAARIGGIGANRAQPAAFFYDNVMMGTQLVDEARHRDVEKLVLVGTVCAYPKLAPLPFVETDLWNGYPEETNAPYGIAKRMLIVQAQAYRQQYGLRSIVLLPANLYGPGDRDDLELSHVIPALIRKLVDAHTANADEVVAWGDGQATREFLYVDDAARAVLLAAEHYDDEAPVNVGSGQEVSIADIAERLAAIVGYRGRITWDASRPNGQPRRRLDVERAREQFGFEAGTSLDAGLRLTVEAYLRERARTPASRHGS